MAKIKTEDLVADLKRVATELNRCTVPVLLYEKHGKYSQRPILDRFGKWDNAIRFAELTPFDRSQGGRKTLRTKIGYKMRFKVMARDNFRCVYCGRSPAQNPDVVLHVDHILPVSRGGGNEIENLQTLCSKCNLGKSAMIVEEVTA